MNDSNRCLVADANPLNRFAIEALLGGRFEVESLASRAEALDLIRDVGGFGVTVIDFCRRPGEPESEPGPTEAVREIRKAEPTIGIVAHGDFAARHHANQALQSGATAYVTRQSGPECLLHAVAVAGELETYVDPAVPPKGSRGPLTRRQRQILELLADGRSTAFAAQTLGLSEETVKSHTKNLLSRMGARNRAHAVAVALRSGLVE